MCGLFFRGILIIFSFFACPFLLVQADEWLIIANGPSFSAEELKEATCCGRKVLALDGAANQLKKYQLFPDVILGDFDSIEDKDYWGIVETFDEIKLHMEPYMGCFQILIVPAKNQDLTDLEKGILYCDQQGAETILILNATGGRMDHTLGNVGVLRKYYNPDRPLAIQTATQRIEYVKDSFTVIEGEIGDYCAIMGYPEAIMYTSGLTYNGENYPLRLGIQESTCNTLAEPHALVMIQGEALVISPKPNFR